MILTKEEQEIYNGKQGEVMAKIMKTLVLYGDLYGAKKLVPINHNGHLVTSMGIGLMKPVFRTMDEIINAGIVSKWKFTADPRPIDYKNVKCSLIDKLIFSKIMYSQQKRYEKQLLKVGLINKDAFSCVCYSPQMGNVPNYGDVLSWAESSAVVYANSVLGARCNRNSGMIDLFGCIIGKVPEFGLLLEENRKADWFIEIKTNKLPEAQILGSVIGLKVQDQVPYIKGLDKFLGNELNNDVKAYLKDMGAACASNGAVGLFHIENLTPEVKGAKNPSHYIKPNAQTFVITEKELEETYNNYPVVWKDINAKPSLCFIGCPHLTLEQLNKWTENITTALKENNRKKLCLRTILTTSPAVLKEFKQTENYAKLIATGAKLTSICPLMYTNNPLAGKKPIITCSNKLRTYSTARYKKDAEIINIITGKEK